MQPSLLPVAASEHGSFRCVRVREQTLVTAWHFHPEYQLTFVVRGNGQRIVGDSIAPLCPGDLTLLGPNVPHCWDVDLRPPASGHRKRPRLPRRQPVEAVIVQFNAEFPGPEFWGLPETAGIVRLLRASARGLSFPAAIRKVVAPEIARLPKLTGMRRMLGLMHVLDTLANARSHTALCSAGYHPHLDDRDRDRLAPVIQRIHDTLWKSGGPAGRTELAALAGLAEHSFSRYFRARMGRTLPHFVNELRIGRARWLLAESDLPVATVAARCGFRNLSNFNSQFRTLVGTTPLRFREQLAPGPTPPAPARSARGSSR